MTADQTSTRRRAALVPIEAIAQHIHLLRGVPVLLDVNLATLYGVETRTLVQAVKRNIDRFPEDFIFLLKNHELAVLRSQSVISSSRNERVSKASCRAGIGISLTWLDARLNQNV